MAKRLEVARGLKPNFERIDANGVSKFIGTVNCIICDKPNIVTFSCSATGVPNTLSQQVICGGCGNKVNAQLDTGSLSVTTSK